jgi:hypothetical protein
MTINSARSNLGVVTHQSKTIITLKQYPVCKLIETETSYPPQCSAELFRRFYDQLELSAQHLTSQKNLHGCVEIPALFDLIVSRAGIKYPVNSISYV